MNNSPINIFQNMLRMGTTPQQIEQMIFANNPQLQVIANQMRQSGLAPIEFAMQFARQRNIDPSLISQMTNQMKGMLPR